jgi:hypothetical protein
MKIKYNKFNVIIFFSILFFDTQLMRGFIDILTGKEDILKDAGGEKIPLKEGSSYFSNTNLSIVGLTALSFFNKINNKEKRKDNDWYENEIKHLEGITKYCITQKEKEDRREIIMGYIENLNDQLKIHENKTISITKKNLEQIPILKVLMYTSYDINKKKELLESEAAKLEEKVCSDGWLGWWIKSFTPRLIKKLALSDFIFLAVAGGMKLREGFNEISTEDKVKT